MARKRRKENAKAAAASTPAAGMKVYRTAVYVRLSRDDECSFWYKGRLL